jgi:hypothetical protein
MLIVYGEVSTFDLDARSVGFGCIVLLAYLHRGLFSVRAVHHLGTLPEKPAAPMESLSLQNVLEPFDSLEWHQWTVAGPMMTQPVPTSRDPYAYARTLGTEQRREMFACMYRRLA